MNLANIALFLSLLYADSASDQFRRDVVLFNLLPVEFETNSAVLWRPKFAARTTAGARAEGYTVQNSDFETDARGQASLAWAHYESYASITGTAQRIADGQRGLGVQGGVPGLDEEMNDAANELTSKLGAHVYSGNVSNSPAEIEGLARAVRETGAYAGIDPATSGREAWASGAQTHTLTLLSFDVIRTKLLRPFKDATGRYPAFVMCPGNVFDAICALYDSNTVPMVGQINTSRGVVDIARWGFKGVTVDGVPFIEDRHCTANTLYALDDRELSWRQTPPTWTSMDPGQLQGIIKNLTGRIVEVSDIQAMQRTARGRVTAQVNALAKTGDSSRFQLVLDLQLRLKRRNASSKLTLT